MAQQTPDTADKPREHGGNAARIASKTTSTAGPDALTIREGDELKSPFPARQLDSTQRVRRDGRITLSIVATIVVAGMTPLELEKDLIQRYGLPIGIQEVVVSVVSSTFIILCDRRGSSPGQDCFDHPLTALEAIMEFRWV